jgi:uncharacterized protein YlxW (UPF0749 family)
MPDTDDTTDRTDAARDGDGFPPRHAHRHAAAEPEADAVEPHQGDPDPVAAERMDDDGFGDDDAREGDLRDDEDERHDGEHVDARDDDRDDDRHDEADDRDEEQADAAEPVATPVQPFVPAGGGRFTPAAPSGTRRLWNAVTQKPDSGQVLVAVLVALLGFGAVLQVRADDDDTLANARRDDLVQILDGLRRQGDRLDDHVTELEADRRDLISGADTEQAALEQAQERARTTGVLAGTIAATGPGIIMILDDTSVSDTKAKINAVDMLRAVNELRLAGAEAIQLRGRGNDAVVRVVVDTPFESLRAGSVRVGGVDLEPPYELVAIGEPGELSGAMMFPDGVISNIEGDGGEATVDEYDELTVDVLHEPREPQYARPAPEDEDE